MKFAINYSRKAAALLHSGAIDIDLFKCPAWPDIIDESLGYAATYVHFPIQIGGPMGIINNETGQEPDWGLIDRLLAKTETPFVNLHLSPGIREYPQLKNTIDDPLIIEQMTDSFIAAVKPVIDRYGKERVIIENNSDDFGRCLLITILPQVITRTIEAHDCGFLLDISHAQLAAEFLGMDARRYIAALPVGRLRELHVTGLQCFDDGWAARMREAGIDQQQYGHFMGRWLDHLPMTEQDWDFFAWSMEQIHNGSWQTPRLVTFEYGGISPLWDASTDPAVLAEQVPRLYGMVRT